MNYKKPVWIDTDVSIGIEYPDKPGHYHDLDDALAMISCFNSQLMGVVGVSATFGNIDTDTSFRLAKEITEKFGDGHTRVIKGAEGPIKNGVLPPGGEAAADAMAYALRQRRMTIFSIGSATNIGCLVKKYPELIDQVDQLIAMAGSRQSPQDHFYAGPKQKKPFAALNFESDVEAWELIINSNLPVTFAPFELSKKVRITEEDIAYMEEDAGPSGRYLAPYMKAWCREWKQVWGADGFIPFDALATGYYLAPEFFKGKVMPVGIMQYPDDTQDFKEGVPPAFKPYLIVSDKEKEIEENRRVTFLYDVNKGFKPYLLDVLRGGFTMTTQVLAYSHVNVVVDDIERASEFYRRTLGFEMAYNSEGVPIDFRNYCDPAFARDAGFLNGEVNIDVRFIRQPQAGICLELMKYNYPVGAQKIEFHKTNDMGGPRHVALEVADIAAVFRHLKKQPDVRMINPSPDYHVPEDLQNTDISFFYWIDPYGVQWEMESGRPVGYGRDVGL
ncbi:MAG: nucleoside hydrolase [Desulfobacterales bacterium]|nr:nucleoside hydrolase [Desulfobacterales bacterium]